jgi:hypothetical protein
MILFLIIYNEHNNNENDTFVNEKNANFENDGNMTFDYLTNPNYKNDVLNKYYLDDDIKKSFTIFGLKLYTDYRINTHPYQKKNYRNLYGIPEYQYESQSMYGKFTTFAEYIYRLYGVRR